MEKPPVRRGRPRRNTEERTFNFTLRLTKREKAYVDAAAEKEGLMLASYARKALINAADKTLGLITE
jgi:uncharacterized protein (DUF1778 family)